ncbi:hypothetical protein UFOVP1022_47 [uncultured Caudovirales phage]|uniref:Uncharacterized protein n=1 Tax=uncultured Caudovirales phage TaxID=2100421 RepID=A0A6J5QNV9_9CAUD|nr:hypothetical protein UFOVP1022_47 [uncultured Caudovirales phage]CAB4184276.1 hypothetical protein UFOVP1110_51 [uncultured Caudovirales phage]CAB4202944.1 hypothetical protein UFOVP1378_53 [uncultured Caudovirales phage]CAB4215521.1 hypothetical protein UFOVP1474_33 [uncultured Caudovirales phage]CAB5230167.1 hypothetical protein UFOVP1561_37 [uncultured Caudovirales phage]
MAYGSLAIDTLNASTGVLATQNGMTGIAKAWVNYGYISSAIVINASFNVSSVTRNSTGNWTINFTTAMPNANYCITGGFEGGTGANTITVYASAGSGSYPALKTTTQCQVESNNADFYSGSIIFIGN